MAELNKLGRYELRRILGKGSMGVVYEGYDPTLSRRVAVKTILKSVALDDEESSAAYSARFAREAKAVARLSHPHIVQVYDFGEEGDVAFLVMEFLRGRELRAYFEEKAKFDTAEAVRIALELLDALEFAHESGVIHRDVKPANIMLDAQRRVKLADFGVARIQDGSERSKGGTMVGTPAFMSPEQVSGARVDRRTDLFSTGIVLYELLTGEQAFKGDGAWTVAKAIMQDEPPRPSTIAGKVPPAFDAILSKALAKRPDQRFASAKDFAGSLRAVQSGMAPAQGAQAAGEAEVEFWRSIHASADPAEFRLYLRKFPEGIYAELAQLKLGKLSSRGTEAEPSGDAEELSALAQQAAQLETQLIRKETEFQKREAEARAAREAETREQAESDSRREAELKARAAAEAKAHVEALEKARREAQAALEKREAELRQLEAEALAHANAEARARAAAEARVQQEAELLAAKARAEVEARARRETAAFAKAKEEADARAKLEAAERLRREADIVKREAEAAARETALRKQLAEAPKAKLPVIPVLIAAVAVAVVVAGGWYQYTSSKAARVAELTALLETATRATQQLDDARRQQEASLRELGLAHAREEEARKSGDLAKLKEAQDAARRAESEATRQSELVTRREAEAKKAEDAAKGGDVKKLTDGAKAAAEKLAMERAAAEKIAAEKLVAEKAAAEKAAAEKAAAEKAAAEKLAAEKLAAEKAAAAKAAAAARAGWPSVGDRWVYEARETHRPARKATMTVVAQAVSPSSVRESVTLGTGEVSTLTHGSDAMLTSVVPGVATFAPYLRAFQELRGDELWPNVDYIVLWDCLGQTYCSASARIDGRERVTVPAGTYDAWKIVVNLKVRMGNDGGTVELVYWYSETAKRFVKYHSRNSVRSPFSFKAWAQPDIDMELVSYTPAGAR